MHHALEVSDQNATTNFKSELMVTDGRETGMIRSKTDTLIHESCWFGPYWLCANEYSDATSHLNGTDCLMPFNEIRDIRALDML